MAISFFCKCIAAIFVVTQATGTKRYMIEMCFQFGSSYYRGHLSANNDKAYVYLDRKGNRVKERFDVHRFKEYEFVPDAELDDMRLNLTAEVLRNEYESKLGLMLTQYRYFRRSHTNYPKLLHTRRILPVVPIFFLPKFHEFLSEVKIYRHLLHVNTFNIAACGLCSISVDCKRMMTSFPLPFILSIFEKFLACLFL